MKFIKALVVVILLCMATLLLIGVFVPELDEEIDMNVKAPIVQVYAGMMNSDDLTKWVGGLESVERTGGVLAMPGSTFELHFKSKETEETYKLEILELTPLKSFKYRVYSEVVEIEVSTNYEVKGFTTDMEIFIQMKGKTLIAKSFLPLMKSAIMDELRTDFEKFKELQEQ